SEANGSLHYTMDAVLAGAVLVLTLILAFPLGKTLTESLAKSDEGGGAAFLVMFGIPLAIACFFYNRPLRFGGAIAAILLVHALYYQSNFDQGIVYKDRSYFGFIRVREGAAPMPDASGKMKNQRYTNLMHGNIDHGKNFQ